MSVVRGIDWICISLAFSLAVIYAMWFEVNEILEAEEFETET